MSQYNGKLYCGTASLSVEWAGVHVTIQSDCIVTGGGSLGVVCHDITLYLDRRRLDKLGEVCHDTVSVS